MLTIKDVMKETLLLTIKTGVRLAVLLLHLALAAGEAQLADAQVSTGSVDAGAIIVAWVARTGADRMLAVVALETGGTLTSVVLAVALSKR